MHLQKKRAFCTIKSPQWIKHVRACVHACVCLGGGQEKQFSDALPVLISPLKYNSFLSHSLLHEDVSMTHG